MRPFYEINLIVLRFGSDKSKVNSHILFLNLPLHLSIHCGGVMMKEGVLQPWRTQAKEKKSLIILYHLADHLSIVNIILPAELYIKAITNNIT